jgi:hypothetical protein
MIFIRQSECCDADLRPRLDHVEFAERFDAWRFQTNGQSETGATWDAS